MFLMKDVKSTYFVRKARDLDEVRQITKYDKRNDNCAYYTVVEELRVEGVRFNQISRNLLMQVIPEIAGKGGYLKNVIQAVRIINQDTGESFLVDPQGYSYARYVAIE